MDRMLFPLGMIQLKILTKILRENMRELEKVKKGKMRSTEYN